MERCFKLAKRFCRSFRASHETKSTVDVRRLAAFLLCAASIHITDEFLRKKKQQFFFRNLQKQSNCTNKLTHSKYRNVR